MYYMTCHPRDRESGEKPEDGPGIARKADKYVRKRDLSEII